ncbi:hypothetical protein K7472_31045 [Streptomyces sp. PTM05]|uniref:Uncharacterized protein n=1 Tax=Streptantibioticus parmotrematis TaxID=2873249 RepID=A0ABS7R5E5_9ACTN|nr:hypothetical protein [Streptantibioticus parmotrematis]MBY8889247.1 hypothetical protein [Streptantibioticus parmotrematis]
MTRKGEREVERAEQVGCELAGVDAQDVVLGDLFGVDGGVEAELFGLAPRPGRWPW